MVSLVKREGGEKITHAQNEHDGVSNALAGGVLLSIKPPSAADVTAVTRTTAQKRQEYFESRSNPRGMTAAQVADATGIHWVTATSGERVQYRDLRGL